MQTLHNINQGTTRALYNMDTYSFLFPPFVLSNVFMFSCSDELPRFEEAWKGNAKMHLPGWSKESASRDAMRMLFAFTLGLVLFA